MPARHPIIALAAVVLAVGLVSAPALGGDCLKPARGAAGGSLADLGEVALERLPWDVTIVRANLSARRAMAVSACYLMEQDLLVVSQTGLVYCMSRRDLTPRWVSSLKAPLAAVPGEGPTHYAFLVKAADGSYWVHAFAKRSGAEDERFPARLPFAASSGVDLDQGRIYLGSLGSPRNNRTVESVSLVDGRRGWGWRTRGLLWASPALDPSGTSLLIAGEDGTVTSLPTGEVEPAQPNWTMKLSGAISGTPVVTPAHVVVGSQDGLLRCLDLGDGEVKWLHGLDGAIRTSPWVLGRLETVRRGAGIEGAPEVQVEEYQGEAFALNHRGLFAFDLESGKALFSDPAARKPVCRYGDWVVTVDANRTAVLRNAANGFEVEGRLGLQMFDLIPTNSSDGAIYGITHDGGLVAAIPSR